MITMFSLFAEIERDLIPIRTKEGLAAARASGKQLGRPKGTYTSKLDERKDEIKEYLNKGVSITSIAKIYIDTKNFSIRRMEIVPTHMKGYRNMMKTAFRFKSKLILKCDMAFDHEYEGLFFPTNILISERYKGGAFIYRNMGPTGWEKSRTIFKYSSYQFFNVDTEMKIQK